MYCCRKSRKNRITLIHNIIILPEEQFLMNCSFALCEDTTSKNYAFWIRMVTIILKLRHPSFSGPDSQFSTFTFSKIETGQFFEWAGLNPSGSLEPLMTPFHPVSGYPGYVLRNFVETSFSKKAQVSIFFFSLV